MELNQITDQVKSKTVLILGAILLVAGGYAAGRYLQPAKVVTVTQEHTDEHQTQNQDTHSVTQIVQSPDGTVATTTTTDTHTNTQTDISIDSQTTQTVENQKPKYKLYGLGGFNFENKQMVYGAGVAVRIIGPVFGGAQYQTNQTASLTLGLEL